MFIPGYGSVANRREAMLSEQKNPGTAATAGARAGILGPNAPKGAPGYNSPINILNRHFNGTNPLGNSSDLRNDLPYSRVAKPLSADLIGAFGQRRLVADQSYQNALAQEESGIGRFRTSFEAAKQRLDNEYSRASSRLGRQLAGRGLARSPMLRGRGEREMGQIVDEQLGEMKLNLSSEIEALQQASEMARIERMNILAQIEQDEALARSNSFDYIQQAR